MAFLGPIDKPRSMNALCIDRKLDMSDTHLMKTVVKSLPLLRTIFVFLHNYVIIGRRSTISRSSQRLA